MQSQVVDDPTEWVEVVEEKSRDDYNPYDHVYDGQDNDTGSDLADWNWEEE